ncbi:MAG TPA: LLM class flavin-dependent oxidoreductase, partial [Solirubrobacteraceae bacterium]|nr:LLM class flavin-dependent oxidoreductase [Solirubrobacteraceae bacterium]
MTLDLRAWINPQSYDNSYASEGIAREAAYFSTVPEPVTAQPEYVVKEAREYEHAGYDSATIPQSATWPDVTVTGTWALAHTRRLRVALAHRPGVQAPTYAARALATLDRLCGGRTSVHLILGGGADLDRDGDHADRDARYRRADEYLQIFIGMLERDEPFDFDGEFYSVRGAYSGPKPVQQPRPLISTPATSPQAIQLAVRHADILAYAGLGLDDAAAQVQAARRAAGERELGYWMNLNMLVGESDEAARRHLAELEVAVARLKEFRGGSGATIRSIREDRFADVEADAEQWRDGVLYYGLTKLSRSAPVLVGSPQTIAEAVLAYHRLGFTVVSLGSHVTNERDAELRRETLSLIHRQVAAEPVASGPPAP